MVTSSSTAARHLCLTCGRACDEANLRRSLAQTSWFRSGCGPHLCASSGDRVSFDSEHSKTMRPQVQAESDLVRHSDCHLK